MTAARAAAAEASAPGTRRRLWIACGRLASPLSAAALLLAGVLGRSARFRRAAGDVLSGRRSLAGPSRAMRLPGGARIAPGVFSERALSENMNLENAPDAVDPDADYLRRMGPKADLSLVLRGAWSSFLDRGGRSQPRAGDHFDLFGVIVNNSETPKVLGMLEQMGRSHPNLILRMLPDGPTDPAPPAQVCFVNAHNFNIAAKERAYMRVLRDADLVLPDGIGVKIALQMAGGRLRKNLNGTDLLPHIAGMLVRNDWPVFLLGAEPEVLARAKANLEARFAGLAIAGARDGFFREEDEKAVCEEINASGAMVLVIGMGTPRQELWAARNAHRLRVAIVLSMGGLLDFLGEKNRRAPLWMRQAGLEWIFRLLQEPGRMWRRYLVGNPVFLRAARRWIREGKGRRPKGARP